MMNPEARREAKRLIRQLIALLEEDEHLGTPTRSDHQIIIPVRRTVDSDVEEDPASIRALLAAWLDDPSQPV